MSDTIDIEALHAKAAKANAEAAEAERKIAAVEGAEAEERFNREETWDRATLDAYKDRPLAERESELWRHFDAAVASGECGGAEFIKARALRRIRGNRRSEAASAAHRLGLPEGHVPAAPGPGPEKWIDAFQAACDRASANLGEDDNDLRQDRRTQFIEGDDSLDASAETFDLPTQ